MDDHGIPAVGGVDFVAKKHRGAANSLLDDPTALWHTGDELQHVVPLAVGCWILHITLQESVRIHTVVRRNGAWLAASHVLCATTAALPADMDKQ